MNAIALAETPEHIKIKTDRMEIKPWKESRPSRPATSVRAQRTAAAANARPHASLPVRPAAAWPTRSARIRITKLGNKSCRLFPGGSFYVTA